MALFAIVVDVAPAGIAGVQKPGMARTFHILVSWIPAIRRDDGFDILSTTNVNIALFMSPFFIECPNGSLFALYWSAVTTPPKQAALYVPAFAEEMNKSRRMVALQARALADKGYAVLVLDLLGMGDSAGDFAQASWEVWLSNLDIGICTHLQDQGIKVSPTKIIGDSFWASQEITEAPDLIKMSCERVEQWL